MLPGFDQAVVVGRRGGNRKCQGKQGGTGKMRHFDDRLGRDGDCSEMTLPA